MVRQVRLPSLSPRRVQKDAQVMKASACTLPPTVLCHPWLQPPSGGTACQLQWRLPQFCHRLEATPSEHNRPMGSSASGQRCFRRGGFAARLFFNIVALGSVGQVACVAFALAHSMQQTEPATESTLAGTLTAAASHLKGSL